MIYEGFHSLVENLLLIRINHHVRIVEGTRLRYRLEEILVFRVEVDY